MLLLRTGSFVLQVLVFFTLLHYESSLLISRIPCFPPTPSAIDHTRHNNNINNARSTVCRVDPHQLYIAYVGSLPSHITLQYMLSPKVYASTQLESPSLSYLSLQIAVGTLRDIYAIFPVSRPSNAVVSGIPENCVLYRVLYTFAKVLDMCLPPTPYRRNSSTNMYVGVVRTACSYVGRARGRAAPQCRQNNDTYTT